MNQLTDPYWYAVMGAWSVIAIALIAWIYRQVVHEDAKQEASLRTFVNRPPPDSAISRKAERLGFTDGTAFYDDAKPFALDDNQPTRPAA